MPSNSAEMCLILCNLLLLEGERENLYEMTLDMFEIGTDCDGHQFVFRAKGKLDKNHGLQQTTPSFQGRMYESTGQCRH